MAPSTGLVIQTILSTILFGTLAYLIFKFLLKKK